MKKKYLLTTEDGTATLFLEEYEQAMHSMSGAYEESLLKHIIPSKILERDDENLSALDIGFGLGYNVLALMSEFINKKKSSQLNIISLEKEKYFLEYMNGIKFNDSRDEIYSFIKEVYILEEGSYHGINLKILFGDARETLKGLNGRKFHAVFQDAFSPSKNPELWSMHYFIELKNLLKDEGIITTYSSADHIRRAMIEAGLRIGRGPSVGKKREGTIASLTETIQELSNEDIVGILNNIKSVPYEDPDFNLSRETILENRLIRIKKIKIESK
ncbi:MAG TPA: MnmC family methyltransferase [Spirochaetota bacterium]|nr:MnmC family methyltransferase [Spirochaetota bacterium]HPS86813.1 MnmC family methyltransferase [Spirochaetota bacterium]